jgi:hypothetical protein
MVDLSRTARTYTNPFLPVLVSLIDGNATARLSSCAGERGEERLSKLT